MAYSVDRLVTHIHWMLDKPTSAGWNDIRRNVFAHTFYWIHEGKGTFTADREYAVEGGTLAYLRPGLPLSMRSVPEYPLHMTMVLFDCAAYAYDRSGWVGIRSVPLLRLPFLQRFEQGQANSFSTLFRQAALHWLPGNAEGETMSKTILLRILLEAHREGHEAPRPVTALRGLEQVKEHLERFYYTDIAMAELSAQYGISPSYLRKQFRVVYGCGPKRFLTGIRNEHAIRHLLYSEATIQEIAKACGYPDMFHFSKAFKQMNGVSPAVYRKREKQREPGMGAGTESN